MAEPARRGGRASRDLKRLSASLAVIALQRLSDPDVRAQLAKHGRTLLSNAQQWRQERSAPALGERFGRRKLERRIARLRSSVLALGEGRPDLAVQLDPVLGALEEVSSAVEVAALQSLARRARAYQRVDRVLDGLEVGLFEAALPAPGSDEA